MTVISKPTCGHRDLLGMTPKTPSPFHGQVNFVDLKAKAKKVRL